MVDSGRRLFRFALHCLETGRRLLLSVTGQSPALSLNSVPQCEQVLEED